MKVILLGVCTLALAASAYLWQGQFGDDEIFLLPSDYRGVVVILYDQKNGEPVRYERGKRVYRIPPDGILRTQDSPNSGWHRPGSYSYEERGEKIEIPYVLDGKKLLSGQVQVCCSSSGRSYRNDSGEAVEFEKFYVGTKEEIEAASELGEKIHPADLCDVRGVMTRH